MSEETFIGLISLILLVLFMLEVWIAMTPSPSAHNDERKKKGHRHRYKICSCCQEAEYGYCCCSAEPKGDTVTIKQEFENFISQTETAGGLWNKKDMYAAARWMAERCAKEAEAKPDGAWEPSITALKIRQLAKELL